MMMSDGGVSFHVSRFENNELNKSSERVLSIAVGGQAFVHSVNSTVRKTLLVRNKSQDKSISIATLRFVRYWHRS